MPLSELGISEVVGATESLGLPLSIVNASLLFSRDTAVLATNTEGHRVLQELVGAGVLNHHPALVLFRNATAQGNAILGFKRESAYRSLIERRMVEVERGGVAKTAALGWSTDGLKPPPLESMRIIWKRSMEFHPGAFFRAVPGTDYITLDAGGRVYLLNVETGERLQGPGFVDLIPTPDGQLFVTPGSEPRGLEFYATREVVGKARNDRQFRTVYRDPQMTDQYPSVGLLRVGSEHASSTYRVLTSWFGGLAMRDYRVKWFEDGSVTVSPVDSRIEACDGVNLSIPMLSHAGTHLAARDERTGTTKLFALARDGSCRELVDIGRQTSKVGFSPDDMLVSFSALDSSSGVRVAQTFVFDTRNMQLWSIPGRG